MQGLTDEQIEELKLRDEWSERCHPSGGHIQKTDEIGRRNGIGKNKCLAFYCFIHFGWGLSAGYQCWGLSAGYQCWGLSAGYQPRPQVVDRGTTARYGGQLRYI